MGRETSYSIILGDVDQPWIFFLGGGQIEDTKNGRGEMIGSKMGGGDELGNF